MDTRCLSCGTWGSILCDRCAAHIGTPAAHGTTRAGVPIVALGEYHGALRSVILAAKHRGAHSVVRRLGDALRDAIAPFGAVTAVPVPSSRPGHRARGFGLGAIMAKATGLPVADCLVMEDTGTQRGRHRDERRRRQLHVATHRPPVGTRVVLLDDVLTTGASIDSAIDACCRAGLRIAAVLVLAVATPPRRDARLPNSRVEV